MTERNINDIHNFIRFMVRKERGAFTTDAEIDALLDQGQLELFEEYIDLYARTQKIHDALSPFKKTAYLVSNSSGTVSLPTDYLHLRNFYTILASTINRVIFPEDDEYVEAVNSQLRPISTSYTIGIHETDVSSGDTVIILKPASTYQCMLHYFRRPAIPVFAYTESGRTITYDANNSTQLEWMDTSYINKIILKALGYLGINLNEQDITQFGIQDDKNIQ